MQFSIRTDSPSRTDCAILPIFDQSTLSASTKRYDAACGGRIVTLKRSGDANSKLGQSILLKGMNCLGAKDLLLLGCGRRKHFGPKQIALALNSAAAAINSTSIKNAASFLCADAPNDANAYDAVRATVGSLRTASYRFAELKSKPNKAPMLAKIAIVVSDSSSVADARRAVLHGTAIANGTDLARDLGNRPPNVCTPSHIADTAIKLAALHSRLKSKILAEAEMKKLGMGALLSVTLGAAEPARFVVIEYRGASKNVPPVVLCGKGVTFDTGGISLKPPPKMDEMKFDMCGAAGVLGTMLAVAELDLKTNVIALIPACENMPGSRATRPGDIIKSMSGQTIEILNTDAEGRMILCDAITYAHTFNPRCIIDVATLTGACVIALGPLYTGVFSNDDALASALISAGAKALDDGWRMPVDDEYGESLRSNFADFANAGSREGGASVAAQFLSRFVNGVPWAHLDIAGVAWKQNAAKGATGRPVPLLTEYLIDCATTEADSDHDTPRGAAAA